MIDFHQGICEFCGFIREKAGNTKKGTAASQFS